jgi:hypothetical protein
MLERRSITEHLVLHVENPQALIAVGCVHLRGAWDDSDEDANSAKDRRSKKDWNWYKSISMEKIGTSPSARTFRHSLW